MRHRIRIPIGTKFGRLMTTSDIYAGNDGRSDVMASCVCGTPPRGYHLTCLRRGATRSCGCLRSDLASRKKNNGIGVNHPGHKGINYPRKPFRFLLLLNADFCAWPLCGDSFLPGERVDVDHDHRCPGHGITQACIYCVRGAVHHKCNIIAGKWDWAQEQGLGPIAGDIAKYLNKIRPLVA